MAVATHSERPPTPPVVLVDDTLLVILGFCVFPKTSMSKQDSLIAFPQVCRRWRKVALECPHPWTYIRLTDQTDFESLLNRWIERSQRHPLDVEVTAYMTHSRCRILDQLLTSDIARVRSLNIKHWSGPGNWPSELRCFAMGLTSPILNSLSLRFYSVSASTEETPGLLDFPALKVLSLGHAALGLIQQFRVPMKLLTDLTIVCGTVHQKVSRCAWLTFLKSCPQLTVFKLIAHCGSTLEDNASVEHVEPLILHNLTHLTVVAHGHQNLSLLENIQAPFLQCFRFEGPNVRPYEYQLQSDALFDVLLPILESCQETLLELSLWKVHFSVIQVAALLAYGKQIEKLDITHSSLLQALVPPFGSHPTKWPCPYLQEITVHDECAVLPDFVDLLKQRTSESTMLALCPNGFHYITRINLFSDHPGKHLAACLDQVNEILKDRDGVVVVGLDGILAGLVSVTLAEAYCIC